MAIDSVVNEVLADRSEESIRTKVKRACEGTDINPETVRKRLVRKKHKKERSHGNQLLTDAQELVLVGTLRALASAGIPMERKRVIELARDLYVCGMSAFLFFNNPSSSLLIRFCTRSQMGWRPVV